jgi:hypothetical protein
LKIYSQHNKTHSTGCDNPYSVRIYNETQSGLQLRYILNVTSNPRQVVFILNNTWMLVSIQYSRVIQFYSVNLMTNTFQYNQSVSIPYDVVWSMTKRNDTLIYICFWVSAAPIYTLSYNGFAWVLSNLTTIEISSSEISTQVAIDSCARIWVAVYGFGIRIYDPNGLTLLANWSTVSTGIDTLLVLDNYEIFLGDYDNNKIFHFAPNLQCTS